MFWCTCFGSRPKGNKKLNQKIQKLNDKSLSSAKPASALSVSQTVQDSADVSRVFTYRELATATNNFKTENIIGRGGFGCVYKGVLESTGEEVAVKMLDPSSDQGDREFLVEVVMLSHLRHENLVRLIGFCAEGEQRLLVYEYMPLGSVEDHMHNKSFGRKVLDWNTRMRIAAGAAKGLEQLHNVAKPPVIFRDMKIANILLDHGFKPKLSDFGLAKIGPTGDASHITTNVVGTLGYCAPEYAKSGKLTVKSDVYSFGVVLLELITGHKALMGFSSMGPDCFLGDWALALFKQNNLKEILDEKLTITSRSMESTLRKALEVAFMCLREEANDRPTISDVVIALNYIVKYTTSKKKKTRVGSRPGGGDSEKSSSSSSSMTSCVDKVEEEEANVDIARERKVAEAKKWAESHRDKKKSIVPPSPNPEKT